jgi:hypothetical protein
MPELPLAHFGERCISGDARSRRQIHGSDATTTAIAARFGTTSKREQAQRTALLTDRDSRGCRLLPLAIQHRQRPS